ncbi:TolC family protein [Polluticoccus soli]|uniref:TolC family protein n=1 Tax=Polluticoccus soli TaxID=3034150 RepID=UPI0023E1E8D7|nr:TolC family protein [Flavipsychrobacter sp. JY13-12]
MKYRSAVLLLCLLVSGFRGVAQDTLTITLRKADSLFFNENYYLLASAMNIQVKNAEVLQAKLYPNPTATAEFNAYDPENHQAFHVGQTGEKIFQFEQLIILGGKRKSEIEMAKMNADIAALEFQDLVRQLKYRLHKSLFAIGQQQILLNKYSRQLALLDTILASYEIQVHKGNMPLKDLVRLKGGYLNLNNDRAALLKEYFDEQTEVQTLLRTTAVVAFRFTDEDITNYIKQKGLEDLKTEALSSHPDLLIMEQDKTLADRYWRYQKQLVVPDVNLYSSYDQRGGAFANQVNAGLSIDLPLWNRNQGNIRAASYQAKQADYSLKAKQQEVLTNLQNSYALYTHTVQEYQKLIGMYNQDFEITLKGMTENFQKRNISLIEFVDFFESYNLAVAEQARIKTQLVSSAEQLNLSIGKDIY